MRDLELRLVDRPGAPAQMGRALGEAGVSVEGGGVFVTGGAGVAHFLLADPDAELARSALNRAGIELMAIREVLVQRLRQEVPGQVGAVCGRLAEAGVNETMYGDHDNQLILVVDDHRVGRRVRDAWTAHDAP